MDSAGSATLNTGSCVADLIAEEVPREDDSEEEGEEDMLEYPGEEVALLVEPGDWPLLGPLQHLLQVGQVGRLLHQELLRLHRWAELGEEALLHPPHSVHVEGLALLQLQGDLLAH